MALFTVPITLSPLASYIKIKRSNLSSAITSISPPRVGISVAYVEAEVPVDVHDACTRTAVAETQKMKAPYANPSTTHMQATNTIPQPNVISLVSTVLLLQPLAFLT